MKELHDDQGYFKIHWELLEELDWKEAVFLEYLIEIFEILKKEYDKDGVTYKRVSNSFIQERIDITAGTITKYFDVLMEKGYVAVVNVSQSGKECNKGVRYYRPLIKIVNDGIKTYNNTDNDDIEIYNNTDNKNCEQKKLRNKETKDLYISKDIYVDSNESTISLKKRDNITSTSTTFKNEQKDIYIQGEKDEVSEQPAPAAPKAAADKYKDEIKQIIDYLNSKANKNYRYNSEANNTHIRARFNEGFTIEDFKKVIDNKCQDAWFVENNFLRPMTLFAKSHFESYLNETPKTNKSYIISNNQQCDVLHPSNQYINKPADDFNKNVSKCRKEDYASYEF